MSRIYLVITLSGPQDARDLYRERGLTCASCGAQNGGATVWALPGLCADCAMRVESVTAAAPRPQQAAFFDLSRLPE
jgi:hypothetical protein